MPTAEAGIYDHWARKSASFSATMQAARQLLTSAMNTRRRVKMSLLEE